MYRVLEVQITCGNLREAKKIAETLLKEKLIACANIIQTSSIYEWKGKNESHSEEMVFMKTTEVAYPKVEKRIKELHSYEVPAIIAVPVEHTSEEYKKWVFENVKL
jgi:periplasmic divalent cation tolerance protein